MSTWTEERITKLRELLITPEPLSAADIGAKLGVGRNAVIGKVGRLGLKLPQNAQQAAANRIQAAANRIGRKTKPRRHATRETMQVRRLKAKPHQVPRFDLDEIEIILPTREDSAIPLAQRRTLIQLKETDCHWPVGDPLKADFFFCGGAVVALPYCQHHTGVSVRPFIPQRRRAAA